jgi:hypothetical protein
MTFKNGDRVIMGYPSAKEGETGHLVQFGPKDFHVVLDNFGDDKWHFDPERDYLDPVSRSPLWQALE